MDTQLNENLRLKNKICALKKEILINNKNHQNDLKFYQEKLSEIEIQKDEEETYLCCKGFEEIEQLERELIHKTEKVKLVKCVYLAVGLIIGVIVGSLL